jgi:hypothetical protein
METGGHLYKIKESKLNKYNFQFIKNQLLKF